MKRVSAIGVYPLAVFQTEGTPKVKFSLKVLVTLPNLMVSVPSLSYLKHYCVYIVHVHTLCMI